MMSTPLSEVTMVLVTRDDLKLSKGKLAAQCSHAAVNCAIKARKKPSDCMKDGIMWEHER